MYMQLKHYLSFFFSCPIRNLTLALCSSFIYIKSDVNIPFYKLISTVVFSTSKQLLKVNCMTSREFRKGQSMFTQQFSLCCFRNTNKVYFLHEIQN